MPMYSLPILIHFCTCYTEGQLSSINHEATLMFHALQLRVASTCLFYPVDTTYGIVCSKYPLYEQGIISFK
jgi:hypothetical protein